MVVVVVVVVIVLYQFAVYFSIGLQLACELPVSPGSVYSVTLQERITRQNATVWTISAK